MRQNRVFVGLLALFSAVNELSLDLRVRRSKYPLPNDDDRCVSVRVAVVLFRLIVLRAL